MKIIADANIPFACECFSSLGDVTAVPAGEITADAALNADILLVRSVTKVNEELLKKSGVKFVGSATSGFEHVDIEFLQSSHVGFAYAPGSNANSVAEYVIAAMLAVAKKYKFNLVDKSIGIIGAGRIGTRVADKTGAVGMKVLLNDPPLQRKTNDPKYLPLDRLYDCDFISMHTPLTYEGVDKTFHLADKAFFDKLKAGAFFINTARGSVADTEALKNAIRSGKLAGTVLDVWENEPNIDNELLLKAELSTPHIAGYSLDGKVAGLIMLYQAACKYFGVKPEHTTDDFLAAPDIAEIIIDPESGPEQNIIHNTVQQIYAVNRDDFNTREILIVPPEQRAKWFNNLRAEYPARREFQNTRIVFKQPKENLAAKLKGIGFKVQDG
ncbi:MAG TPA: 4-phosphoerythronate dehydrogenase [Planctomycetes bacterium]|nr:4-phosphoerythronate dehydrogenase [Planctomycetota bacterium]